MSAVKVNRLTPLLHTTARPRELPRRPGPIAPYVQQVQGPHPSCA